MNQERNVQKRIANLMANDVHHASPSDTAEEEMKVCSSQAMDDDEFNLHQNYHNAIDCLLHCERLITDLQGQITLKNDHICTLEDKLVTMSLELASAKAVEDEHQLLKRRMSTTSGVSLSNSSSEYSCLDTVEKNQRLLRQEESQCIIDFAPSIAARRRSTRASSKPRPTLSRSYGAPSLVMDPKSSNRLTNSWSGSELTRSQSATTRRNDPRAMNIDRAEPMIKPQRGSILSRVMTWVSDDMALELDTSTSSTTKDNTRSLGAGLVFKKGVSARQFSMEEFPGRQHQLRQGNSYANNANHNAVGTRRRNPDALDDASFTTRQFSTIGSLLGLKKHDDTHNSNHNSEFNEPLNFGTSPSSPQRDSACSSFSSRSCISGVVFPVSSGDCLRGCDENDFESRRGRVCSNTANDVWPILA